MGSAPEDQLRAATVILVFFICPRLFLFDLRSVSLLTFLFLPSFLIAPWTLSHAHGSEQSQAAAPAWGAT
jgi:hypothetical protein